jgi:GNAT superfamily N-acetyltransferase
MATLRIERLHNVNAMLEMFSLLKQLNPDMTEEVYRERLRAIVAQGGYFQIACYIDNTPVGVTGVWIGTQLWCGKFIEVDNFVVDQAHRKHGVGRALLEWVENKGREEGCQMMRLDSYVTADTAHRFYFRHGLKVRGFHMTRDL